VEELVLPELTAEQIETLCSIAENAARKYVLSKVPSKKVNRLNVSVEADGTKPLNLSVELDVALHQPIKDCDLKQLVDEAAQEALKAGEEYLRNPK
jgi:hypothetical protein